MSHSIRREIVTVPFMAGAYACPRGGETVEAVSSRAMRSSAIDPQRHPVRADARRSPDLAEDPEPPRLTLIGVHEHERVQRQEVRLDVARGRPGTRRARRYRAGDRLPAVAGAFREHAAACSHRLLETLAEEPCRLALDDFGVDAVRISIEKFGAVAVTDAVGVEIERRAEGR